MRLNQLDPGDARLYPTMVLVLSKREEATIRAMLRICDGLASIGYPDADAMTAWLETLANDGYMLNVPHGLPTDEATP